jgi:DNA-binding response OmpR family regulator
VQQPSRQILVVDDDREIRMLVVDVLEGDGYEVVSCSGGEEALRFLRQEHFDLLLADIKMAGLSGTDLLARVRTMSLDIQVIIMTAYGSKETAIEALRGKAFDYLEKPFTLQRFRTCVQQALQARPPHGRWRGIRSEGELTVDTDARRLWVRGQEVQLTRTEFDVLAYLFGRLGCAVSHRELLEQVWGDDGPDERSRATVKSCVCRLRKKIGDDARRPRHIRNVRGVGYQLGGPS